MSSSMDACVCLRLLPLILLSVPRPALTQSTDPWSRSTQFTVPSQGKGYCPVNLPPGMSRPGRGRTRLECCGSCAQSTDGCLHASFDASNGSCVHFYFTPSTLVRQPNCDFFLNPSTFKGCFGPALMRLAPGGCVFPFQFNHQQWYNCAPINDSSGSQCITSNGDVSDCAVPPGFNAVRTFTLLNVGPFVNAPLPCVANWYFLMIHSSSSYNFPVDYASYVDGFGDLNKTDFWSGLEKMHQITNAPGATFRLRVEIMTYWTSQWFFAEYSSFSIDSANNNYALHVSGYAGDAGDSLSNYSLPSDLIHDGMQFTTIDRDNDRNATGSCAEVCGIGWWYNNCYYSVLTGHRFKDCYFWNTLKDLDLDYEGKPRAVRMLVRRV